jgi:2'-5' RNA ligase
MLEPAKFHEFEIWPKHITIVPWFPCDNEEKLDEVLTKIAARHKPVNVEAGGVEEWGRQDRLMVQVIKDEVKLKKLHLDVYETLENNGFYIHQKDYLGEKYRPHITLRNRFQKNHPIKLGAEIKINNFALIKQIRLKGSGAMIKSVAKEYPLHG